MMQKIGLYFILVLLSIIGFAQATDFPILNETPKRGIYQSYEEFKFNVPGITDSFYVESNIRTQKNWEGTNSYSPRYVNSDKRVKKVWGFSDGQKVYKFHQWEFFEVTLDSSIVGFYAYGKVNNVRFNTGSAMSVAGQEMADALAMSNAKMKKIYYPFPEFSDQNQEGERPFTKLIIYRRGKKEKLEPLLILVNDSIRLQLVPNTVQEIEIPISREQVQICYGNDLDHCIDFMAISDEIKYYEGSISSKTSEATLTKVKPEVGEFYSNKAKSLQAHREKKKK